LSGNATHSGHGNSVRLEENIPEALLGRIAIDSEVIIHGGHPLGVQALIFGEPDIDVLDGPDGQIRVKVNGVDVFHPQTGEVRSDGPEGIACWFIDSDYNEESFFVRHAYFLGANDP
jgi:hypothetical protein